MENWMIILNEVIKWGSIIACIVWPVYIIKKGCITYVIEKRISATESKKNEILWTDWKNDEELKRKKEWEQYLSTLKTEVSPVEETLEIINLKMKIEKFNADNSRFGVVLSEVMKNHHVSGSDLMFYAGMHKENIFAI